MNLRKVGIGAATGAVFVAGLWAGIGSAGWAGSEAAIGLRASLGVAAEVPKPQGVAKGATGTFTGGLTKNGKAGSLSWRITFKGLTGRASAAHIHLARPGKAGPVAVPLCGPCRSGVRGTARLNAKTTTALLGGAAYVNVHTAKNPAGEVPRAGQEGRNASGLHDHDRHHDNHHHNRPAALPLPVGGEQLRLGTGRASRFARPVFVQARSSAP